MSIVSGNKKVAVIEGICLVHNKGTKVLPSNPDFMYGFVGTDVYKKNELKSLLLICQFNFYQHKNIFYYIFDTYFH